MLPRPLVATATSFGKMDDLGVQGYRQEWKRTWKPTCYLRVEIESLGSRTGQLGPRALGLDCFEARWMNKILYVLRPK